MDTIQAQQNILKNIGCVYNRWNEYQHAMKMYGNAANTYFTKDEIRESYHICFPDAQSKTVIKEKKLTDHISGETLTVIAQLTRSSIKTCLPCTPVKKMCKIGCGREAAEWYDTCCRTCMWYPNEGWHGPTCDAKHFAKADVLSNGMGPSDDEKDDPDAPITNGIPMVVPPQPGQKYRGAVSKAPPPALPQARVPPPNRVFEHPLDGSPFPVTFSEA